MIDLFKNYKKMKIEDKPYSSVGLNYIFAYTNNKKKDSIQYRYEKLKSYPNLLKLLKKIC